MRLTVKSVSSCLLAFLLVCLSRALVWLSTNQSTLKAKYVHYQRIENTDNDKINIVFTMSEC